MTNPGSDADSVWSRPNGPRITVLISGEVDMLSMPQLDDVLGAAVADCETGVDVDLSGVTFMESTGIRSLVKARNDADRRGVDLVIAEASDWVRQLLARVNLEHLLVTADERGT